MRAPRFRKFDPFDDFTPGFKKKFKWFDLDGDGIPDVSNRFADYSKFWGNASSGSPLKSDVLKAKGMPKDLTVTEDSTSNIDLSAIKLKYSGKKKDILTIELAADAGTLEATSTKKVTVSGSGTDTLTFTGTRKALDKFLNDKTAITYSGAQDASGDNAANLTLSHIKNGTLVTLGQTAVDITDVPDDLTGTAGNDTLTGDQGVNTILGLAGNDVIDGGAGADILSGDTGVDWLYYDNSQSGVTVDLNANGAGFQSASGGDAQGDVISGFENVRGSDFDDVMVGTAGANYFIGQDGTDSIDGAGGNDIIRGGAGADTLVGGAGVDVLQYEGSTSGVTVDLNADGAGFQMASGGDAQGDIISGFENVFGSDFDDVITGNAGRNYIIGYDGNDVVDGGDGNDVIRGGAGGDTLEGGNGTDLLQYAGSAAGVTIDLTLDASGFQQASGGDAQGDILSGFENVYGSDFGDMLVGDANKNTLFGYDGNDIIDGGAGNDVIRGGLGADTLAGGGGVDWLRYAGAASAVTVDLNADAAGFQSASGGEADGDIVSGFENAYGTSFDDLLIGDANANILYGGAGADTFVFNAALDSGNVDRILDFNPGDDTIQIDDGIFAGLVAGALAASQFNINSTGLAETADQRITYDSSTGNLYFDGDGNGAGDSFAFANLTSGLTIDESDIFII